MTASIREAPEGSRPCGRCAATDRSTTCSRPPGRHPPPRHGSRFGTRHEPSLFHGAGFRAFEFTSARDPARGHDVAPVEPAALVSNRHLRPGGWFGSTAGAGVTFPRRASPGEVVRFAAAGFLVDGALPRPA